MLKILIVDDEPLLRIAVKSLIDWEANGFRMLQDVSNGGAALDVIEKEAPDILITDIKMPGMNGVELIKQIESKYPHIKTIVLSNFDDFSFVKEALTHGAVDYILKATITPEILINAINNLKEKLKMNKHNEKEISKRESEVQKNFQWLRNEFLKNLINGKISAMNEIQFNNRCYEIGLKDGKFVLCTILADEWSEKDIKYTYEEKEVLQSTIKTIIKEILGFEGVFFPYNVNHYVLIIYMDSISEGSFINSVYEILGKFQTVAFNYTNISFTIGISAIKENLLAIPAAYRESIHAAVYKFYIGKSKIYKYGEVALKAIDPRIKWMNKENIRLIRDSLERGKKDVINEILKACFIDIEQMHYDIIFVKQFFSEFIIFFRNTMMEMEDIYDIDFQRAEDIYNSFNKCETYSEAKALIIEYIKRIELSIKKNKCEKYSYIVSSAIESIYDSFDSNITLNSISEQINVNKSYLSRLFFKETGQNFIDFLTEVRVKKAKKLLDSSNLNVYEVGEKVGYQNPKYFNKIFKKVVGVSPYKYRMANKTENDETK